jgi:hypothetical protein
MTASATTMHDCIEMLRLHALAPALLIHPCGAEDIHRRLLQMRDAVDNPAEVVRFAAKVRDRVVQELLFAAESVESSHCRGCFKEAYQLRRQAERFRASHPYPPDDYCDHLFRVYGIGGKVLARLRAERSRRIAEAAEQERELTVRPHTDAARVFGGDV